MNEKGRIVLLGNAGVVIFYKKTRIMVDGLYKDLRDYFTDLPPNVWQLMQQGRGDLANVEYVFFTHSHFDHYYSPYFAAYMAKNKVQGLILPPLDATEGLAENYARFGAVTLPVQTGTLTLQDDIKLEVFTIRHVDKAYYHIPVQCFLFTIENKSILILADADYAQEAYQALQGRSIDYAFVTPVFYNNALGRNILYQDLNVQNTIIYHLPAVEDDKYMYNKMVARDIKKYAQGRSVRSLNRFGQYVAF